MRVACELREKPLIRCMCMCMHMHMCMCMHMCMHAHVHVHVMFMFMFMSCHVHVHSCHVLLLYVVVHVVVRESIFSNTKRVTSPRIGLLCLREHPRAAGWGCGWS